MVKREGEEGNGRQARRPIHLMPQCCLAWLPFVAESAGQRRKADTKNRQDALQDTLCAIAIHRRQDKAVSCLDTSLTRSLQLSHGTGLTMALLLGLARCYSGASATTYTHTIWDHRALRTKREIQHYKTHLFYRRSSPSLFPSLFMDICLGC